jgi:hypothetical protein
MPVNPDTYNNAKGEINYEKVRSSNFSPYLPE